MKVNGGFERVCRVCVCVRSESQEQAQHQLSALDQEIEKQTVQLREWQLKELLKLRQQLHIPEREKQQLHLQEVRTRRRLLAPARKTVDRRHCLGPSSAFYLCDLRLTSSGLVYRHVYCSVKSFADSFINFVPRRSRS